MKILVLDEQIDNQYNENSVKDDKQEEKGRNNREREEGCDCFN